MYLKDRLVEKTTKPIHYRLTNKAIIFMNDFTQTSLKHIETNKALLEKIKPKYVLQIK